MVNGRVAHSLSSMTVSLSVRLSSYLTGWSGTSDTRDQIKNRGARSQWPGG